MKTFIQATLKTLLFVATIGLLSVSEIHAESSKSNEITQTIRGEIVDKQSQVPLPGVNIIVTTTEPAMGVASDLDGYFKIEGVPVGRHTVKVSFLGYEEIILSNIDVTSGKQVVLRLEMEESVITVDEVTVSANRKASTINQLTTLSARTFSVEETNRFAGSNSDVSRMAMNFAGVASANDAVNDIVIRGNSPIGLLWRLDGIDIPNPNHYGDGGATGGPVSMLNNNVLSNSDFMTGAFPAEYGNALSGVFDLKMRTGNNEKHEFLGQIGFNGFEIGAEGPFSKKSRASYLINYRYSTLVIFQKLGFDFGTGTAIPYYQDLSGKIHVPTKNAGTFSLITMGGKSSIDFLDSERDTTKDKVETLYESYESDLRNSNRLGLVALTHKYLIDNSTYTNFILSAAYTENSTILDSLSTENRAIIPWYRGTAGRSDIAASAYLNKKFNAKNNARIGASVKLKGFSTADSVWREQKGIFEKGIEYDGQSILIQPYIQWQYKLNEKVTVNTGIHSEYFTYNNKGTLEPRIGLKYKLNSHHAISLAYGLHSQNAPLSFLEQMVRSDSAAIANGEPEYVKPNTNLDFTFSHHVVAGYDFNVNSTVRFKAEVYYQYITGAITELAPSAYSSLNRGSFSYGNVDYMSNDGTGYNYGAELTLEKFLDKGFYYLITASVFESKYRGSDDTLRSTAFNGNYVFNTLVGKEFKLVKNPEKNQQLLTLDAKFNLSGGQRYTPVNLQRSKEWKTTVYQDHGEYSQQLDDYMRLDLRVGYKIIYKKYTQEWAVDFQNVTNHANAFSMVYDEETNTAKQTNQLGFMPMFLYRVTF